MSLDKERLQQTAELAKLMREPRTVLGLIIERDQLKAENAGLKTGYEAYELVVQGLKAEVEALRKSSPSKEVIWCSCGDGHAANSYGAGFMDANGGVCANCDAANQGVEPDLDALRRDAERYRRARDIACRVRASVGFHLVVQLPSPSGSSFCAAKAFDEAIDAVMSKGDQA